MEGERVLNKRRSAWEYRFARAPSAREEATERSEGADSRAGRAIA